MPISVYFKMRLVRIKRREGKKIKIKKLINMINNVIKEKKRNTNTNNIR